MIHDEEILAMSRDTSTYLARQFLIELHLPVPFFELVVASQSSPVVLRPGTLFNHGRLAGISATVDTAGRSRHRAFGGRFVRSKH